MWMPLSRAREATALVCKSLAEAIASGTPVQIRGLMMAQILPAAERPMHNPVTMQPVAIRNRWRVAMRASNHLVARISTKYSGAHSMARTKAAQATRTKLDGATPKIRKTALDAMPDDLHRDILRAAVAGVTHQELARLTGWSLGSIKAKSTVVRKLLQATGRVDMINRVVILSQE
jgi:nucleoid DNA-binding protein